MFSFHCRVRAVYQHLSGNLWLRPYNRYDWMKVGSLPGRSGELESMNMTNEFCRNPKGGVTFYYRGKERNSMETVGCSASTKK